MQTYSGPTTAPRGSTGRVEAPSGIPPQLFAPVFNVGTLSITPIHLIIVGIAAIAYGWKGGLCAGILIYFYLQNLNATGTNRSGLAPDRGIDAGLRNYFQRDPSQRSDPFPSQRPPSQPRGRRLNED